VGYYRVIEQIIQEVVSFRHTVVLVSIDEDIILVLLHHRPLFLLFGLLLDLCLRGSALLDEERVDCLCEVACRQSVEVVVLLFSELRPLHFELELLGGLCPLHHPQSLLLHSAWLT
jgi:hypothetical protein